MKTPTRIAYDISQMRPGCAIVQAAMGCDPSVCHEFPTDSWLVAPTDGMKSYPITSEEQLNWLVEMTKLQGKY